MIYYNTIQSNKEFSIPMKNLTKGNPLKLILLFALPLFIGQIFQLFYGLVDTRIVGETLGETSLAAVGSTTAVSDLMIHFMNGLTNGFAIIVATFFGAEDEKALKKSAAGTLLLGLLTAIVLTILATIFLYPILGFLNTPETILVEASSYIHIIILGLAASALYNACASILRAVGDSVTPLIFLILSSFLNIFLDYAFIKGFHFGVEGAALATVISQIISMILCLIYMVVKYPVLRLKPEDFRISPALLSRLIKTGLSMAFMVSFVSFGTLALQTSINTFGNDIIVAHSAARKATSIFMLPFGVFGTTLATYCGQNLGAGKPSRIKKGILNTILLTWAWCAVILIIVYTCAPLLIHLITTTTNPEILDTATLYLRVNSLLYFVPAVICLLRNGMQGIGDHITPVFSSIIELVGKVLAAMFFAPAVGYWGIILSEPIVWCIMVIPLLIKTIRNPLFRQTDSPGIE